MNNFSYGKSSQAKLATIDERLGIVFRWALSLGLIDITIIEGVRSKAKQNRYYDIRSSKVRWPFSKHNVKVEGEKCKAIDAGPYINDHISYDIKHCIYLAGIIVTLGSLLGIKIRWGGNWDMDTEVMTDQDFQDLLHYELVD